MKIGVVYCTTDVTPDGREMEKLADLEILDVAAAVRKALQSQGHQAIEVNLDAGCLEELRQFDWIFNLIEMVYGYPLKDYEVTAAIEAMGIPFTGSGSVALKTCTNKSLTKHLLRENGILTPRFNIYEIDEMPLAWQGFPLIVKPLLEDGSVGIYKDSVVYSLSALTEKVRAIHTNYHQAALVEEYIEGRDISIPILGNGDSVQILPPLECVFSPNFDGPRIQTFESKWVEDSADYRNCYAVCPCDLDAAVLEKIKEICSKAYCLLGCRDYARVDLRLRDHSPYIIEVNPNPCINPHDSGVVRAAQAAGYPFDGLINLIFTYSQINWKYPIPGMEGAIHGHLIDETHQERPVSSNQFITEN